MPVSSSRLTAPLPARRLQRRPSAYCARERPSGRCSPHTPGQASPGSVSLPPLVSRALSPPGGEWGWGAMRSRSARSRSRADAVRRVRPRDQERSPPPGIQQISCRQSDVSRRPERSVSGEERGDAPVPRKRFPATLRPCAPFARLCGGGEGPLPEAASLTGTFRSGVVVVASACTPSLSCRKGAVPGAGAAPNYSRAWRLEARSLQRARVAAVASGPAAPWSVRGTGHAWAQRLPARAGGGSACGSWPATPRPGDLSSL